MNYKEEFTSIKKASDYINSLLQAKGFLEVHDHDQPVTSEKNQHNHHDKSSTGKLNNSRLLFCSVDYRRLMNFDIDDILICSTCPKNGENDENQDNNNLSIDPNRLKRKVILNESLVNNDKNIINIIYSLLKNLESSRQQKEYFLQKLQEKDNQIKTLELENKTNLKELDITNQKLMDNKMSSRVQSIQIHEQSVTIANLTSEIAKLKHSNHALKANNIVDLRRKDLEISSLKDKLLDKKFTYASISAANSRNIKNANVSVSINTLQAATTDTSNNNDDIDNPMLVPASNKFAKELNHNVNGAIDSELEKLLLDSSDLISSLTQINVDNLNLIYQTKDYVELINAYLSTIVSNNSVLKPNDFDKDGYHLLMQQHRHIASPPPNPVQFFENHSSFPIPTTTNNSNDNSTDMLAYLRNTTGIQNDLVFNLKQLHNLLNGVVLQSEHKNQIDEERQAQTAKIEELQKQLLEVTKNWQNAIDTMQKWRRYRDLSGVLDDKGDEEREEDQE